MAARCFSFWYWNWRVPVEALCTSDLFYEVLIIDYKFKLHNTWIEWNLFSKCWNREKVIVTGTTSVILGSSVSQRGNYSKGWWFSELVLDIKVLEIWNYSHFQLYEVPITWRIMGRWRWLLWTKVCRSVDNTCINRQFFFLHNPKWYDPEWHKYILQVHLWPPLHTWGRPLHLWLRLWEEWLPYLQWTLHRLYIQIKCINMMKNWRKKKYETPIIPAVNLA